MIQAFLQLSFRHFSQQKGYALINVTGLATGLACMLLAVLCWKDERSFNLFHDKTPQLYRITTTAIDRETRDRVRSAGTRQVHGPAFQEAIPEISNMTRLLGGDITGDVRYEDRALRLKMLFTDDNFFTTFSFPLLQGHAKTCLQEINSIVLSEESALKFFGSTDVLGKFLYLDADPSAERLGYKPMVVTGVAKSLPAQSSVQFDVLMPIRFMQLSFEDKDWLGGYLGTFVVVSNNANIGHVEQKMDYVFKQSAEAQIRVAGFDPKVKHQLQNIADIHLDPIEGIENSWNECGVVNGSRPYYSNLFLGAAFFILLLASINFINISIASSIHRAKEVGIRKLNGSGRGRIFGQFLGESALLCGIGMVLAFLILELILPAFNQLTDKQISLTEALDVKLIAGFFSVFLLNVVLSGAYPAWLLSAFKPIETLYNRSRPFSVSRLGRVLVVMQFTLALFLALVTMVFYAQMRFVQTKTLGYEPGYVVRSNISGDREYEPIRQVLRNETAHYDCFEGISFGCEFGTIPQKTKLGGEQSVLAVQSVDQDYLGVMDIALRNGGNFSTKNSREVIINEAFAKLAGLKNPIGAEVKLHQDYSDGAAPYTIVGVIADYHYESLHKPIQPLILYQQHWRNGGIWLKIRRDKSAKALAVFERIYRKAIPGAVYESHFISDLNAQAYHREQRWQAMIGTAALLAILICCLGLVGLSHLNAAQRTKEIGIRKVLGASIAGITGLLTKDFMKLVLIAIVIASPIAWYFMDKWLADFAYRIEMQWWMFAVAGSAAVLIALLTVGFQSVKAALANPVKSLRSE